MSAVLKLNPSALDYGHQDKSEHLMPLLNRLRFISAQCRASARLDLFNACSFLAAQREDSLDINAEALVRVINQAIDSKFRFSTPGSNATTFDEDWLLRLIDRLQAEDYDSLNFLYMRRVAREKRGVLHALLLNIAKITA
ncbi:MAG: hypothetical protein AAF429_10320 [Pseudomonadota bacterium]